MRPGLDSELKARVAALSGAAARALGPGIMRPCADVRVRHAVGVGLTDPDVSDRARRELSTIAQQIAADEEDGPRSVTLRFRVSEAEAEEIRDRADAAGLDLSAWIRQLTLAS